MNRNEKTSALISESLLSIRERLRSDQILASDAALKAIRLCRMLFSETRLAPITRELLGYSTEQAQVELELITLIEEDSNANPAKQCIARHRLISGFRLPLFVTLRQAQERKARPNVTREQRFCGLTAMEIEAIATELAKSKAPYVVLEGFDDENGVFVCKSKDFKAMHQGLKKLIIGLIDVILFELQSEGHPLTSKPSSEPDEMSTSNVD